jgi:hypothetical protein
VWAKPTILLEISAGADSWDAMRPRKFLGEGKQADLRLEGR